MNVNQLAERLAACDCGHNHGQLSLEDLRIEAGALAAAAAFASRQRMRCVTLLCDERTYEAAGKALERLLQGEAVAYNTVTLKPNSNGDVLADEISVMQALMEIPNDTEMLYAVGAGTIHDIARFVSYKMHLPFVSVPTAASVDGFNSKGSPLIVRGFKTTVQLHGPLAVFADLDVLVRAPKALAAAGFGDMIAKYTSLLDWTFSHLVGGEPYCRAAAEMTREALERCVASVDSIASGSAEGMAALMDGLLLSGFAMLGFGQSHPASGGEHHVSHMWEMEALQQGKKQVLHGAKVGVSSRLVASRYIAEFASLLEGCAASLPEPVAREREKLAAAMRALPSERRYREWLERLGGPVEPTELGIDELSVAQAMRTAHTIRPRYTILRFLNELQESK